MTDVAPDERRRVAERLRELASDTRLLSIRDLVQALGVSWNTSISEMATHLADLIDPTCEVVSVAHHDAADEGRLPEWWEYELSCGHVVPSTWPVPPTYCDQCGRRVVAHDKD